MDFMAPIPLACSPATIEANFAASKGVKPCVRACKKPPLNTSPEQVVSITSFVKNSVKTIFPL